MRGWKLNHSLFRLIGLLFAGAIYGQAHSVEAAGGTISICEGEWHSKFVVGTLDGNVFKASTNINYYTNPYNLDDIMEVAMADAARYFSGLKFTPPKLLCLSKSGETKYIVIYKSPVDEEGSYAEYDGKCYNTDAEAEAESNAILIDDKLVVPAYQAFRTGPINRAPLRERGGEALLTPAHELFHAVQQGYPMFDNLCPDKWVTEGLAEALGVAWIESTTVLGDRSRVWRDFSQPLHEPTQSESDIDAYGTWMFWQFLAREPSYRIEGLTVESGVNADRARSRRFDPFLIHKFFKTEKEDGVYVDGFLEVNGLRDQELRWLDFILAKALNDAKNAAVKDPNKRPADLKGGLIVVYPKFIARLDASLNRAGRKNIFGGPCEIVDLRVKNEETIPITINEVAARCIRVDLNVNRTNKTFTVIAGEDFVDATSIHLGWAGSDQLAQKPKIGMKSWMVAPKLGEDHVNLIIANVAPKAIESVVARFNLKFEYGSKAK